MTPGCRNCSRPLDVSALDLGMSPLANSYLPEERLNEPEPVYPLNVMVCESCFLVQLDVFESPQNIFSDYAYFSSWSQSWLEHSKRYAERMIGELGLDGTTEVVEIASNDGYLLKNFVERGIPVLGIEPAVNVAAVAERNGVNTVTEFFGAVSARELANGHRPRLLIGNNVLAHVPELHDFVEGLQTLLRPDGVITMEFPHLLRLVEELQFDTIYHEHFSYLSMNVVREVFAAHGLDVARVEELETHGGSLRIFATHAGSGTITSDGSVERLIEREEAAGLRDIETYKRFAAEVLEEKTRIIEKLHALKDKGARIWGYGAPAKGNTLLNYCGIGRDVVSMTVDANPAKQGLYLPGSHIPIGAPETIAAEDPDCVWILPWNLRDEIAQHLDRMGWRGTTLVRSPGKGLA